MPKRWVKERVLSVKLELALIFFAFLLHFPWEILQSPFYRRMPELPHWDTVQACLLATVGDVGLTLLGFWTSAAIWRSRGWILRPTLPQLAAYLVVPLILTLLLEHLSARVWGRWSYTAEMPVLPVIGTGLAPLLQWVVLP